MINSGNKITFLKAAMVLLFAIISNLAVQIFAAVLIAAVNLTSGADVSGNVLLNYSLMILIQAGFLVVIYFFIIKPKYALTFSVKNKIHYTSYIIAAALAVLCILAFYAPALWFGAILDKIGFKESSLASMSTPLEFIVGTFAILVAAPVVEEIVFRGVLLSGLKEQFSDTKAVLLSALAFMMMHMNPSQTVYQFLLAVIMGFAVIYTGSVRTSIVIHAFSNLLALLLEYTALGAAVESFILLFYHNIALSILISVLVTGTFGTALFFILKFMRSKKPLSGSSQIEMYPLAVPPRIINEPVNESQKDEAVPQQIQAEKALPQEKNRTGFMPYLGTIGICVFMWIFSLVSGIITN